MIGEDLRKILLDEGATIVGFAVVEEALEEDISHLGKAISIGIKGNLKENTLEKIGIIQKVAASYIKDMGHRYFCIPPDSDRIKDKFQSKLYPLFTHKVAATCAGLGWIGRNGLLISERFGPRLSLATVLTDAPLKADEPIRESLCGNCRLCVEHCPSKAITGDTWSRKEPFPELIMTERCRSYKENSKAVNDKPNCGLCINICPYGRNGNERRQRSVAT
ncbi:MAG: epoxyqueuosine reductase [Nitrospirota bacterium]|nr:MAG: epoxyqueuosine reductase [Nitrospirota bacterium]